MWVKQIDLSTVVRSCTHTCIKKIKSTIRFKMLKFFKSCYVFYLLTVYILSIQLVYVHVYSFSYLLFTTYIFFCISRKKGISVINAPKISWGNVNLPRKRRGRGRNKTRRDTGTSFSVFCPSHVTAWNCGHLQIWMRSNVWELHVKQGSHTRDRFICLQGF